MTKIGKKLAAVWLALAMVITFVPLLGSQAAYAAGDYSDVQNVNISEEGVLTWDAYPGADTYWIGIDGSSLPTTITTYNLKAVIDRNVEVGSLENSGTHTITIEAYGGDSVIATWNGTYEYTSPYSPVTVGSIENVAISSQGIMTWDPYSGASIYQVGVDNVNSYYGVTESAECNLHDLIDNLILSDYISNSGTHAITIRADNERYIKVAEWTGSYYYESAAAPIVVGTIGNVSISPEGLMTWDAYSGTEKYWIGIDGGFIPTNATDFDLNAEIDRLVESGGLENSGTHSIRIEAHDSGGHLLATWDSTYDYTSSAVPVVVGAIENVSISTDGTLTWDAYTGATTYWVGVNGRFVPTSLTTHRLDKQINQSFLEGSVGDSGPYMITVEANNERGTTIGKWEGTFDYTVSMEMKDCSITGKTEREYNGNAFKPTFKIDYMGYAADYTMTYTDSKGVKVTAPTNAGTYYAVITGSGYYDGTMKVPFLIYAKSITPTVSISASAYTWNGKAKKPVVTVKDGSTKLAASDYTVTYKNNKNVGKGSAVVTLKGNYSGTKTVTFKINPKGTSLSKVTSAKKAATVKWKKQSSKMSSSRITGYQIQLATNSKFTKGKKTVNVNGYKTVSKKVTGLKGGKKYYVKIRTYKTIGKTKYYSPWSKVKTVKTKK